MNDNDKQTRYFELRQEGERVIKGTALRYGDIADLYFGKERFTSGAFKWNDVILNVQHQRTQPLARTNGGGLEIINDSKELSIRATLPDTTLANDTLKLIQGGVLRGLSIEFIPEEETKIDGVNEIRAATLYGVGIVDTPAYPDSILREDLQLSDNKDWWALC